MGGWPGRPFLRVAAVVAASLGALTLWALAGWPGAPNACLLDDSCFCEAARAGLVRQPANTSSNFGFIAVGLLLAARARSSRAEVFAAVVALLGPGSMALHGSLTHWGGVVDVMSMFLFIGFALAHNATRLWPALQGRYLAFYAALAAALCALEVAFSPWANAMFAALVALYVGSEFLVRGLPRDRRWLAACAGCFALATALWLPSRSPRDILCDPASLLQPHGAWHLLCALAAGALYLYLEPELEC